MMIYSVLMFLLLLCLWKICFLNRVIMVLLFCYVSGDRLVLW